MQIWSEGSVTVSGSGWVNQTNTAANLQVYGVTPPSYVQRDMIVSGSGTFVGVFNGGTTFDLTISGGASFIGAAIGREADYSGSGKFHYDETLANLGSNGAATSYQYASRIEDIR